MNLLVQLTKRIDQVADSLFDVAFELFGLRLHIDQQMPQVVDMIVGSRSVLTTEGRLHLSNQPPHHRDPFRERLGVLVGFLGTMALGCRVVAMIVARVIAMIVAVVISVIVSRVISRSFRLHWTGRFTADREERHRDRGAERDQTLGPQHMRQTGAVSRREECSHLGVLSKRGGKATPGRMLLSEEYRATSGKDNAGMHASRSSNTFFGHPASLTSATRQTSPRGGTSIGLLTSISPASCQGTTSRGDCRPVWTTTLQPSRAIAGVGGT